MRDCTFDNFHQEIENIRSMINAVEHSIRVIDENMVAFKEFERLSHAPLMHQSTSLLELRSRRSNLASTLATLSHRLESMERAMSLQ